MNIDFLLFGIGLVVLSMIVALIPPVVKDFLPAVFCGALLVWDFFSN